GAVVQDEEGRWALRDESGELGLPESVREVIGRRARRLGEETRRTLAAAAVIGRDFEFELLAEIVEQDEDAVLDRLAAPLEASLTGERAGHPGSFTFTHALVEHTPYEDLGSARRARLHRQIAEALERQLGDDPGERVGELARHWSEAVKPVETAKAADYAAQAGQRALDQLAPDEAQRWFERALELLDGHDGERRRALADEALALARRADDPRLLCNVLLLHTFAVWLPHTVDERVQHLHEATELAEQVGDPGLTFLTASRACNVLEGGDLAGFD